ncbi:hypothetical protein [Terricaulis silvestris]|uniref:Regulatory protein FlaEY n=1 Tax=Terricaulis silvestris TaxID=2686094 RepID=A0A6I6MT10_9CAUL|nr:hypothetical protein [Terricaulis silvestris]QGZ94812.1 hypothetical protein DSM104635_01643 [Terricaulis silvestris]
MVSTVNSAIASALFGASSSDSVGVSADMLTAWARAKAGVGVDTATATQDPNAPITPVWTPGISPSAAALVQRALSNKAFFDTDAKLYSDLGATGDYKRLFALYSGLSTLQALAGHSEDTSLSKSQLAQTAAQFTRGLGELEAFFTQQQFEDIRLAQGDRVDATQSTLAMPTKTEDYTTAIIHRGGLYNTVSGLADDAKFNIVATSAGGTVNTIAIDLSEMGSITRTLGNVVSYVNGKLAAAGAASRIETVDLTPKTSSIVVGGRAIETRYTGPRQYALRVDVRSSEKVAFEPIAADPAFYVVGQTANGARLIKLSDVDGAAGQPVLLDRPGAATDPTGANVATGWLGPGAPYTSITNASEQRTNAMMTGGLGTFETLLRDAGEAVLQLEFADGRKLSVSTGWRSDDLEAWRTRAGESNDRAIMDDLAERLTQLLHEQGVAAAVDVWEDAGNIGFSVFGAEGVRASNLSVSGRNATITTIEPPGMVGGLRDGVFARRFEAGAVAAASALFAGSQTFVITTTNGTHTITIDGGEDGVDAATLTERLNEKLIERGVSAAAYLIDNSGALTLRFDALHDVTAISATLNEDEFDATLQAPGAWANGGLPASSAGQPYGDAIRTYTAAGSPLTTHAGALSIELVVATPTGNKTVSVSISAQERLDHPDSGGDLNQLFQDRIATALNAAGAYVGASSGDLTQWQVAEVSGQRIASITVNGDAQTLTALQPSFALGGAQSAERSFTGAQAATGVSDDVAALLSDDNVSITFSTVWGDRTVSASLQPGDPRTLESAALRLNEALASQGYDLGVAATALSGAGAGLRVVTGASHTVRGVSNIALGASNNASTLDAIDSTSSADDPIGALGVAQRASRGAAVSETVPASSSLVAPSANGAAWFPGRAFDVSIGGGAKVATARAVATGADGAVYVLADLSGDSANRAIKGARDVALLKYDSAGKLAFTQMLGASQSASGFALAVSADGKVAVAGSVEGQLSGTTGKGGADSFVTVFDANGKEAWTARRGATSDDQALAIAFAPNGSLVVSGKTNSALGGQVALGQSDGYVRGYSPAGAELFTRQFGTGRDDAASALLVRDDGSGGIEIFTGGVEDNRGVLRRFTYSSSAGFATGATRDIGYFHGGAINAIAADGSSLYVGGEIGADRLTLGTAARGAVAGKDGFVARLDTGLISTSLDRATYIGSSQDDAVKGLAIVGGQVYAAGTNGGVLVGAGSANAPQSFLTRLDGAGDIDWSRTFTTAGGAMTMSSLAVDQSGASPLDILGLPRGVVASNQSAPLVDRNALRVGDEFRIGAEGRRMVTIRITEKDTLATLVNSITRAIGSAGRAEIVKENGVERLKISPRGEQAVRIDAGRADQNALPALGLAQGVVSVNTAGRGSIKTFGLGIIAADLKLDSKESITRTKAELSAAISIVRQAYDTLLNPNAKELTEEDKALAARRQAAGAAPEYYNAQLANYQAALARLGG